MRKQGSGTGGSPVATAGAPVRAGIVLATLILVAAVANLNLAVANVALPSIGAAFDSSQTTLNLIAVGYSLGLAASVLWLGAIGDRYGRKLLLILGTALAIPFALLAAYAPSDEVLFVAPLGGGLAAGMAFPTTLALITALWSGPNGRDRSPCGRDRGCRRGARADVLGPAAGALLVGIGLPDHVAARGGSAGLGRASRPGSRERGDRSGRQSRRHPLGSARRRVDPRDQLRGRAERGNPRRRPRDRRPRLRDRVRHPAAAGGQPPVRPAHRRQAGVLGRRVRGDHRVRLPDGGDVRRSAVPAGRARLLDLRRGRRHPAGRVPDGDRRSALGKDRRSEGSPLHPPHGVSVLPARVPHDAAAVGPGEPVLGGRARVRAHRCGRRLRGDPSLALAHRLGPGRARRHGVGDGRSPA